MIGTDVITIKTRQIKNSLLSSAGFDVASITDSKPSTKRDAAKVICRDSYTVKGRPVLHL
jgi:hypothetical protein